MTLGYLIWSPEERRVVKTQAHAVVLKAAQLERHSQQNLTGEQGLRYLKEMREQLDAIEARIKDGSTTERCIYCSCVNKASRPSCNNCGSSGWKGER